MRAPVISAGVAGWEPGHCHRDRADGGGDQDPEGQAGRAAPADPGYQPRPPDAGDGSRAGLSHRRRPVPEASRTTAQRGTGPPGPRGAGSPGRPAPRPARTWSAASCTPRRPARTGQARRHRPGPGGWPPRCGARPTGHRRRSDPPGPGGRERRTGRRRREAPSRLLPERLVQQRADVGRPAGRRDRPGHGSPAGRGARRIRPGQLPPPAGPGRLASAGPSPPRQCPPVKPRRGRAAPRAVAAQPARPPAVSPGRRSPRRGRCRRPGRRRARG